MIGIDETYLSAFALFLRASTPLMIACVVLYHCGAHLAAPQWSSLMGDIVPDRPRGLS